MSIFIILFFLIAIAVNFCSVWNCGKYVINESKKYNLCREDEIEEASKSANFELKGSLCILTLFSFLLGILIKDLIIN